MKESEKKPLTSTTGRGSGTKLLGECGHELVRVDEKLLVSVVKTKFFCLLNLPLVPLGSYRVVVGETSTEGIPILASLTTTELRVIEKLPLRLRQVAGVYAFALLCLAWWPAAIVLGREFPQHMGIALTFEILGFFLWLLVCFYGASIVQARRKKKAISAQLAGVRSASEAKRQEQKRREEDHSRWMPKE